MDERIQAVREKLKQYGQEHLLLKYNEMSDKEKEFLLLYIEDFLVSYILKKY